MQQAAAFWWSKILGEELPAITPQFLDPGAVLRCKLLFELATQTLGERGAKPGGRDGDLQRAAAHDGGIKKIAVRGVVDCVARNLASPGFVDDVLVGVGENGSMIIDKGPVEIRWKECDTRPPDRALSLPRFHPFST